MPRPLTDAHICGSHIAFLIFFAFPELIEINSVYYFTACSRIYTESKVILSVLHVLLHISLVP